MPRWWNVRKKKYNPGDFFVCIFINPHSGTEVKTIVTITDYNPEKNKKYEVHAITYIDNECKTTVNGKLNTSGLRYWADSRELTELVKYQNHIHYPIVL